MNLGNLLVGSTHTTLKNPNGCPNSSNLVVLPSQTWAHLSVASKANLLTLDCDDEKYSFYCRHQVRSPGSWYSKVPESYPSLRSGKRGKVRVRERAMACMVHSWAFFWSIGGEATGSQHHQTSYSNHSQVCVLVGNKRLTSFTWWKFHYLHNSPKDMTQNVIYSPWGETESSWLCSKAKLLLFCLAWLISFLSIFSHFD